MQESPKGLGQQGNVYHWRTVSFLIYSLKLCLECYKKDIQSRQECVLAQISPAAHWFMNPKWHRQPFPTHAEHMRRYSPVLPSCLNFCHISGHVLHHSSCLCQYLQNFGNPCLRGPHFPFCVITDFCNTDDTFTNSNILFKLFSFWLSNWCILKHDIVGLLPKTEPGLQIFPSPAGLKRMGSPKHLKAWKALQYSLAFQERTLSSTTRDT